MDDAEKPTEKYINTYVNMYTLNIILVYSLSRYDFYLCFYCLHIRYSLVFILVIFRHTHTHTHTHIYIYIYRLVDR